MPDDEHYLRRAILLAMNGRGRVEPNPMVGCVIVKEDRIIGEGFHQQFGHPHAEPNALANCVESPVGATAYVTLEPCCHTNKKTPPCVPRLIEAKVSRVVIGCLDPNPQVNGNGIGQLREAGIVVDGTLLEPECRQLIASFISGSFPYVTLKWAESSDGKIAGPGGQRIQISNPQSSHLVQLLRSRSDCICLGINTVLSDDPSLIPRGVPILRPLKRLVIDSSLRIPLSSKIVQSAKQTATEIFCLGTEVGTAKANQLRKHGVTISDLGYDKGTKNRLSLDEMLIRIGNKNLLVEPGPTLAKAFFSHSPHRLWVIRSPRIIGDDTAPSAAAIPNHFVQTGELDLAGDRLCEYLNTRSNAFFSSVSSADFVLAQTEPVGAGPDRGDTPRL